MSAVEGKRVLFLGSLDESLVRLRDQLKALRMHTDESVCTHSYESLNLSAYDLVVINLTSEETACRNLLLSMQQTSILKTLPVFALVPNIQDRINRALLSGAADYMISSEATEIATEKVKALFGTPNTYAGETTIDISESPAEVVSPSETVRIFGIEDDPLLRSLLSTKFEVSSISYDFSPDGLAIPVRLREFKPSVILLDIMIGGVNGLDVLEEIKSQTDLATIPVVVFSNQDSDEERMRAATLGADLYLVKATTDLSDLVRTLTKLSTS